MAVTGNKIRGNNVRHKKIKERVKNKANCIQRLPCNY
jgi:hypothetical protein